MFNLLSHAKLNLSLEVNSLLDNGFHNLTSIMHTLHLHDEISISHSKNTKTLPNYKKNTPLPKKY